MDIAAHRFEQGLEALERQTARSGGGQEIRSGFRTRFDAYYRDLRRSAHGAETT